MRSTIQKVEIQNFKAFNQFELDLEGRHLLLYGENGSGKSSLYWALYTFLQSAGKEKGSIDKYFSPNNQNNLLNKHQEPKLHPGKIRLTLLDGDTGKPKKYTISEDSHETFQEAEILSSDLASDFINYRFFFGFSHFRFSEEFNLWPLFEREILPFCVSLSGEMLTETWDKIREGNPNPKKLKGLGGTYAYGSFYENVDIFSKMLSEIIDSISEEAQRFYDENFTLDDMEEVSLKLHVEENAKATGSNLKDFRFSEPMIQLLIKLGEHDIRQPQIFLNEAKITQIALSVRFAASLVNLHESDLKLLVLDDLLVSLDMSNRMKVVEILLSDQFADYQNIILTHDLGFFREFQRAIGRNYSSWYFTRLAGNAKDGILVIDEKSSIKKAESYLANHDFEASAVQLRKAAEDLVTQIQQFLLKQTPPPDGGFKDLGKKLGAARKGIRNKVSRKFRRKIVNNLPRESLEKIVFFDESSIDLDTSISDETKKLIKHRRKNLLELLTDDDWRYFDILRILNQIDGMRDRIFNPASHWGEPELYKAEIEKALDLLRQLENHLIPSENDDQN